MTDVPISFSFGDFQKAAKKQIDDTTKEQQEGIDMRLKRLAEYEEWSDYEALMNDRIEALKALIDPENQQSIVFPTDTSDTVGIKYQAVSFAIGQLRSAIQIPSLVKKGLDIQENAEAKSTK